MRYALCLALAVFMVVAVNVGAYLFCVSIGAIYPLTSISTAIEMEKDNLRSVRQVEESEIPYPCEYVIFTKDGQYAGGPIGWEYSTAIWNTCMEGGRTRDGSYLYSVIEREDEILILRYRMTAQYRRILYGGGQPEFKIPLWYWSVCGCFHSQKAQWENHFRKFCCCRRCKSYNTNPVLTGS